MPYFFSELGFRFPRFPFIAHSRRWTAGDRERSVSYVMKSEELREGAEQAGPESRPQLLPLRRKFPHDSDALLGRGMRTEKRHRPVGRDRHHALPGAERRV